MKWIFAAGFLVALAVGLVLVPQNRNDRENKEGGGIVSGSTASSPHHDVARSPSPVGTSGTYPLDEPEDADVIREVETITGINDAMALVGRRVDLHVDVRDRANDNAFWVGPAGNRLLVVLGRDTRDDLHHQRGIPPTHRIVPVHAGQRATISGVITRIPRSEQRYSWDLTKEDEQELSDRKVYIRADTVSSQGHGTP